MLKKKMQNRQKQMVSYLLCACLFVGAGIFYCAGLTEQKEVVLVEQEQDTSLEEQTAQIKETEKEILEHVCGAVKNPGVYKIKEGSRICDIIALAGGGTSDSAVDTLNLARVLKDEERIFVPTIQEAETIEVLEKKGSQKINLNTATKEQLMTLSGIGEAKAEDIIAYRAENGDFQTIEDIMKISGIKEAAFQKIKDKIMVKEE